MKMINKQKNICELFTKIEQSEFKTDSIIFSEIEKSKAILDPLSIDYTLLQDIGIEVKKSDFGIEIFKTVTDFLILGKAKDTNAIVLNFDGSPISFIEGKTYINFKEETSFYFFTNTKYYVDFIQFLGKLEKLDENGFHFIDSINLDHRKIVLTSLSDKGRVVINYTNEIPLLSTSINLEPQLNEFKKCFETENNQLPKFLKSALIEHSTRYDSIERLQKVFINLDKIITSAKVNFEIYLNNLSIDSIRKDYDDFKSKYFNELSSILEKLTNKIIGLPVGIAATLYAVTKVKDKQEFLILIILALVASLTYLTLLLKVHYKDLVYLSKTSKKDYESLEHNKFFKKHPEELTVFEDIYTRVADRINFLMQITSSYFIVLSIGNIVVIGFVLDALECSMDTIITTSVIELLFVGVIRYSFESISDKKKKNSSTA